MILEIGKYATLKVVKEVDFGFYLDGGPFGEILLPIKQAPEALKTEDNIEVFIYTDSEDRIIATTIRPKAIVGELAFLEVVEVNEYGAFMDWGIYSKHLFVPFREQREKMMQGRSYIVYIDFDEDSERIFATSRFDKHVLTNSDGFKEQQKVEILIAKRTPMGYRVIINGNNWGMLYENEIFQPLKIGQKMEGFIKKIREDGKMDLSLQKQGYRNIIDDNTEVVLNKLKEKKGFLPITDKSPPEQIYDLFGISKKNFKKAVGALLKNKTIRVEKDGLHLD
jgi:uncharacterized protein